MDHPTTEDIANLKKEQSKLRASITRCYNCLQVGDPFDVEKVNKDYKKLLEVELILHEDGIPDNEEKKVQGYTDKMVAIRKSQGLLKKPSKPKINFKYEDIPKFNGDFQEWRVFKSIFDEMVTNNSECDSSSKKRHLLRACTGEAADLIKPYLADKDAFKKMMAALTDYYDSADKVKENVLATIRKLPFLTNKLDENLKDFKNKALIIVKHVQEITTTNDDFRKTVRNELLQRWHYSLRDRFYHEGRYSTMQDVITMLQRCHDEREIRIECKDLHPTLSTNSKTVGAVATNTSQSTKPKQCAFCLGDHYSASCKAQMEPATRRTIASDNKLCFNCLKPGHSVLKCSSDKTCRECRRKHHTLLHETPGGQHNLNQTQSTQATGVTIALVESVTEKWPVAGVATSFQAEDKQVKPILSCHFNGNPIKMLLDGGGDQTMIIRNLIRPDAIVRGSPKNFFGVGGKCHSNEMVMFQILCENAELIEITAYVVNSLPGGIDILIGNDQLHKVSPDEALTKDKQLVLPTKLCGNVYYSGLVNSDDKATVALVEARKLNPADDYSRPWSVEEYLGRKSYECTTNLNPLAKRADAYQIPTEHVVATTSLAPEEPTSKAVGAKQTTLEPLKGIESCKEWNSLVEVKSHLAIQTDKDNLDPPETTDVYAYIFRAAQESNEEEINKLDKSGRPYYKDPKRVIRMETRIQDEPGQIWIPRISLVSNFVIEAEHHQIHHGGKRFTKATVSTNYYIPGLNSKVHHTIKTCFECLRKRKRLMSQPTGPPARGDVYERMVGTVKRSMAQIRNCKSALELRYAITEATSIVNSRPLFEDDDEIITPAHFSLGRNLQSLPSGYGAGSIDSIKAYRRILQCLAVQGLKNKAKQHQIKTGDMVLVREPGLPREDWNLARITRLFPGSDGVVRLVEIVYARDEARAKRNKPPTEPKTFRRAVENLLHLELSEDPATRRPEYVAN